MDARQALGPVVEARLVVDDANIVVENVNRHLKEPASTFQAALQASRAIAGPIIAMSIVLIAAYVPIGFQGGLTGATFTLFAFTLAGAVTISDVVALTLSPMMCSKVFRPQQAERRFTHFLDRSFGRLCAEYQREQREQTDALAECGDDEGRAHEPLRHGNNLH